MKRSRFLARRYYQRALQLLGSRFYINPDPAIQKSILVAGTARSGTTWLEEVVASQISCRILFEPFNPAQVPEYREFHYFQYMRPGSQDVRLRSYAYNVFTGNIRNRWIDHKNERLLPQYRLIKEIRANLMLKWLHDQFPRVPIILIIRHPCAVVLSRLKLGWATDGDIYQFLLQADLVKDHLSDYLELIRKSKTDEEKHAIVWCISNLIPLRQFQPGGLPVIYYEDLCLQPEVELRRIREIIQINFKPFASRLIGRPSSTTTLTSSIAIGGDRVGQWKKELNPGQINHILRVVEAFGLESLYGESEIPAAWNTKNLHSSPA